VQTLWLFYSFINFIAFCYVNTAVTNIGLMAGNLGHLI